MDICFAAANNKTQLRVESVHGMLWLQTHFESVHWEAIASQQVIIPSPNAEMLAKDAAEAGLAVSSIPSITFSSKY